MGRKVALDANPNCMKVKVVSVGSAVSFVAGFELRRRRVERGDGGGVRGSRLHALLLLSFLRLYRLSPDQIPSTAAALDAAVLREADVTRVRVKVGIPEFLNGIGKGVETHVPKLETEIGDFQKLLVTRTLKLKKLGIPCKHRKLILKYTHKYRLGLWRPRAEPVKA
ncbi:hypothetical protein JRO89_XS03G0319900 [Xanthoceras sorbifolium]|uniref:Small ribosomal subunit protein mS41 SAM domain-containing protein n=1 Tax=Xanthoceras sorbifolium TaxID=99658 RepID=A0ABQ8ID38_9ROSI|nr:hypothetical protein JRO89_XS03G0319900 [Xanthoceras sorbifolium]